MNNKRLKIDSPELIGNRILQKRLDLNLTQDELSEHLGCSPNYLGQLERGTKNLSLSMAERICYFFGISFDYLLTGIDPNGLTIKIGEAVNYDDNTSLSRLLAQCSPKEQVLCEKIIKEILIAFRSYTDEENQ